MHYLNADLFHFRNFHIVIFFKKNHGLCALKVYIKEKIKLKPILISNSVLCRIMTYNHTNKDTIKSLVSSNFLEHCIGTYRIILQNWPQKNRFNLIPDPVISVTVLCIIEALRLKGTSRSGSQIVWNTNIQ